MCWVVILPTSFRSQSSWDRRILNGSRLGSEFRKSLVAKIYLSSLLANKPCCWSLLPATPPYEVDMNDSQFKVIIVGGSIAGLALAHCLHRAGITCIILEKRSIIAAHEGASVAIMPNGARILDQLGLYDAVEGTIEPMHSAHVRFPDGFHFSSPYPKSMHEAYDFITPTRVVF